MVVISYQSAQFELMVKLRERLASAGIETIDGARTPAGKDWRKFYFTALSRAVIFMPILSDTYLFSKACEDEMTYAWDKRKAFVPVLATSEGYQAVMGSPESYVDRCFDIDEVVPKLESFLNQTNRIPPNSDFDSDFEQNFAEVCGL